MKFRIGAARYDMASMDLVSLKDILMLEKETGDMGHALRWSEIQSMSQEMNALPTDKERQEHPAAMWILAITIWASRRASGDTITFGDAIDFPMRDLEFIPDPQDHKEPARPTKARAGSARAAKRPAASTR